MDKGIIFLDVEANQEIELHPIRNVLLQVGAIRIRKDGKISKFYESVKYNKTINKKVKFILKKDENFFKNQKYVEHIIYNKFAKFCEGYKLYAYGNYDKVVLDEASLRTKEKFKLDVIDLSELICNKLMIDNKMKPSISTLINIFNIKKENNHDALNDSMALYDIYKEIFEKEVDIKKIKDQLIFEYMRPRWENNLTTPFIKGIEEQEIDNNYLVTFSNCELISKKQDDDSMINIANINLKVYKNNCDKLFEIKEKREFSNKKEAEDFIIEIYKEKVINISKNMVFVYDSKKPTFFDIYKKETKKMFLYNNVKKTKVDWFIKHFNFEDKNEEEKEKIIIKTINSFYDYENKNFLKDQDNNLLNSYKNNSL